MNTLRYTLRKDEILRGYQSFSEVLSKGKSLQRGTVRCFFLEQSGHGSNVVVGFSVSRSVRKAVIRNRLKRLMREAYRKNKQLLLNSNTTNQQAFALVFLCLVSRGADPRRIPFMQIEQDIVALLNEVRLQM